MWCIVNRGTGRFAVCFASKKMQIKQGIVAFFLLQLALIVLFGVSNIDGQ